MRLFQFKTTLVWNLALAAMMISLLGQAPGAKVLIVKPGDESATQEMAADFIDQLNGIFSPDVPAKCGGPEISGLITNKLSEAEQLFQKHDPVIVFAPVGFYFERMHKTGIPVFPLASVPRFGSRYERYYLVSLKSEQPSLSSLRNQRILTVFDFDLEYLQRVVFPADFQPGRDFVLEGSANLSDDLFILLEGDTSEKTGKNDIGGLLLDEELKVFFQSDDLIWPEMEVVWISNELPRELIYAVGDCWQDQDYRRLQEHLIHLNDSIKGKELLDLMSSAGFIEPDTEFLNRIREQYFNH
jgi:hypothetical protein